MMEHSVPAGGSLGSLCLPGLIAHIVHRATNTIHYDPRGPPLFSAYQILAEGDYMAFPAFTLGEGHWTLFSTLPIKENGKLCGIGISGVREF
ncbi:MAG: hypothetical protein HPY52_14780 [Firmicutes bacterium]|nr:hypothetical protein [Bacillota bacterium]